jgi:hypothetical protein
MAYSFVAGFTGHAQWLVMPDQRLSAIDVQ